MEEVDVDCASCGYAIKEFSTVVPVPCGHGVIHYNCSYFNNECSVCESKLAVDSDIIKIQEFRPREFQSEKENSKQLKEITLALAELKGLLVEQKQEQIKTKQVVEELSQQLKAKDNKILELQKEIYELKLEKVEAIKQELQEKLSSLSG